MADMEAIATQVAAQAILDHAKNTEKKLDAKLEQMEAMDEDDFERLRDQRKRQLMKQQEQRQTWLAAGHGRYMELPDQPAFFDAVKKSKWMAVHFYRPTTERCQVVDACLARLSQTHLETRFCKIDAEKSPYLCEKLSIFVMPTVLLIKDAQTVHQIRGFDELGGTDNFHPDMMAHVMAQWGVLKFDGPAPECQSRAGGVNAIGLHRSCCCGSGKGRKARGKGAAAASAGIREGDGHRDDSGSDIDSD